MKTSFDPLLLAFSRCLSVSRRDTTQYYCSGSPASSQSTRFHMQSHNSPAHDAA